MPEESSFDAKEFEAEMQRLAAEAESLSSSKSGSSGDSEKPAAAPSHATTHNDKALATAIAQMIRPLAVALSSVDQRTKDTNKALEEIRQKLDSSPADAAGDKESGDASSEGVQTILSILSDQKRSESTSQKLFDAMHSEMKDYKDIFLFEALQKPVIQDMLLLYDDLCAIEGHSKHFRRSRQNPEAEKGSTDLATEEFLGDLVQNLENLRSLFVEIFDRLQVEQIKTGKGKVDKQIQKALSVVKTDDPEEDNMVDKKLRPGFRWRDRVLRPEEVTVKRYTAK